MNHRRPPRALGLPFKSSLLSWGFWFPHKVGATEGEGSCCYSWAWEDESILATGEGSRPVCPWRRSQCRRQPSPPTPTTTTTPLPSPRPCPCRKASSSPTPSRYYYLAPPSSHLRKTPFSPLLVVPVDLTRAPAEETGLHSLIAACLPVFTPKKSPISGFPCALCCPCQSQRFCRSIHPSI